MFEIQNYSSFIAAIVVFQLIPGPGTLATSQPHTDGAGTPWRAPGKHTSKP